MKDRQIIETRVCIDDTLGPFDCKLDPSNRWNGWLSPHFPLDAARQLSTQTLNLADEYGYGSVDTIHVIDGRADSPDTVHIIEGGPSRYSEDEPETLAVAVRIHWRGVDGDADAATRITAATPQARKAARRSKSGGRGAHRAVVIHIRWMYLDEGSDTAANAVKPDREGLFPIGGWEWCWHFVSWSCVCGLDLNWHETECLCGLTRDNQPAPLTPVEVLTRKAGTVLRSLVPETTSALVDLQDLARICAVFAGDTEIDTADDTGPFDTETLGAADSILRLALTEAAPGDLTAAGWEHVPDDETAHLYRITFPTPRP